MQILGLLGKYTYVLTLMLKRVCLFSDWLWRHTVRHDNLTFFFSFSLFHYETEQSISITTTLFRKPINFCKFAQTQWMVDVGQGFQICAK